MSKRALSIIWLNGRLKAAVCQGHHVAASWEHEDLVEHVGELTPLIRQAMTALKFRGSDATFVLDHRQLIYHLQELPPGKPGTLRPLLLRKIAQAKFFDEEAAWGHHPPLPGKENQRLLLTLLPRSVVTGLCGVCAELGLLPVAVFTPSAILATQFKHLHLQAAETVLLAADLGDTLCLVAGRGDGQIMFCRSVSSSGSQHRARAGQEINRTLLYVQQQFGSPINTLWVFGNDAFEWLSLVGRVPRRC
jgi:hypothetical protein